MTSRAAFSIFIFLLLSCTYDNVPNSNPQAALARATKLCGDSEAKLQWLSELIQKSQTDYSFWGPIYAVPSQGRTIFIHQPYIISCLACHLYNCDGTRVDISTVDIQKLADEMTESNLIYSPV
jgi:hypothetical protein